MREGKADGNKNKIAGKDKEKEKVATNIINEEEKKCK